MFQKMGTEDVCNTGLGLGLGSQMISRNESKPDSERKKLGFEPSLTLGLSEETYQAAMEEFVDGDRQASPQSDVSSFSDTRVMKREREVGSEEIMEVERVCRRLTSDEDEESNARKKLRLTKEQSALLEDSFKENNILNPKRKIALAKQLNLRPRQVEVWFQNRRARTKLKQTEVDCEYLKKCCEELTHENKRLQKELHELRALKAAPQFYMHLPAATLTMCPSCERIGDGDIVNRSSKGSYIVAKESQLHNNPFNR